MKTFLKYVNGVTPKIVVTDDDLTIHSAIAKLMPNAKYRLCSWHIERKAMINVKDQKFLPQMRKIIFIYFSEKKFDIKWLRMIINFGLQRNVWVKMLYKIRKT